MAALRNSPVLAPPVKSQRLDPGSPYPNAGGVADVSMSAANAFFCVPLPGLGTCVEVPGSQGPFDLGSPGRRGGAGDLGDSQGGRGGFRCERRRAPGYGGFLPSALG